MDRTCFSHHAQSWAENTASSPHPFNFFFSLSPCSVPASPKRRVRTGGRRVRHPGCRIQGLRSQVPALHLDDSENDDASLSLLYVLHLPRPSHSSVLTSLCLDQKTCPSSEGLTALPGRSCHWTVSQGPDSIPCLCPSLQGRDNMSSVSILKTVGFGVFTPPSLETAPHLHSSALLLYHTVQQRCALPFIKAPSSLCVMDFPHPFILSSCPTSQRSHFLEIQW